MKSTTLHILTSLFVSFFSILAMMFQSVSLWYSESVWHLALCLYLATITVISKKSKARWITAGCLETAEWKYGSCSKRLGHEISPSVVSWIPARLFREEGDFVAHICGFPSGEGWTSVTEFRAYHSAVQSRQHVYYFDYAACTQNLESWTPRDNDYFLPPR